MTAPYPPDRPSSPSSYRAALNGQARGILMQRRRTTGEHASQILIEASQDGNTKPREVAGFVVEHAERAATGGPGVTVAGTPGP